MCGAVPNCSDNSPAGLRAVQNELRISEHASAVRTCKQPVAVPNPAFDAPAPVADSESEIRTYGGGEVNWHQLVERIRSGDPDAMNELYRLFSRGVRFYICRHLGPQDLDDKVHDTFIVVVEAVQRGELREADRLMPFVRTVVRRIVAAYINRAIQQRRDEGEFNSDVTADCRTTPEENAIRKQNEQIALRVLRSISSRDREILTRFYLLEERPEQICENMELTGNQFRILKSRALQRFIQLGKRQVHRRTLLRRAG
jgi:RNA polymerase sigma factor (sigma-70 family)